MSGVEQLERANRLLREVVNMCAIGDTDENCSDPSWAGLIREAKNHLGIRIVGELVQPKRNNNIVLRCGSMSYPCAVVVQADPFILVSVDADMMWLHHEPQNFEVLCEAVAPAVLERCMQRLP